jgi:hypothetical protein
MKLMAQKPRAIKVLSVLVIAMTIGAVVLMALGNNAPSEGPFSLSKYIQLDPVGKAIKSRALQSPDRWDRIEIFYSYTKAGNITQLASLQGINPEEINCHFCLCNGLGGDNGHLQSTERWQKQWSCVPGQTWYGGSKTIRICIVANPENSDPTDYQRTRLYSVVETLCRKFDIDSEAVFYPGDWR